MVSIIVPIYNAERTLARCLKNLQNQTIKDIQVIMVDDGSTDSSAQICKSFCDDSRFEYYYKPNGGVSSARNFGLNKARGSWIGFCDSDDYADIKMYEIMYNLAEDYDCDMAVVARTTSKHQKQVDVETMVIHQEQAIENMYLSANFDGYVTNKLFSKDIVHSLMFDESIGFCEDTVFTLSAILKSKIVACSNELLYQYTINDGSITRSSYSESCMSALVACEYLQDMTHQFYPALEWCVHRFYILRSLEIAMRMALSGNLDRDNYNDFLDIISNHADARVLSSLPFERKVKYWCFRSNRILFIIVVRAFVIYRAMFVRPWQNH